MAHSNTGGIYKTYTNALPEQTQLYKNDRGTPTRFIRVTN